MSSELQTEIARRRTFAIISHPDAGKTTLTEKILLFGGAIQLAGAVKAKRNAQQTRSDWMSIERISLISSFGATIVPVSRAQGGFLGSIKLSDILRVNRSLRI